MLKLIFSLSILVGAAFASAADWFTVVGDPDDANVDTIQLDPVARKTEGARRSMGIRVSRTIQRTSGNGTVFRSYEGLVEFDCDKKTARFVRSQFFSEPLWKVPGPLVVYPANEVRPMAFRLFEPNPRERVIRAACRPYAN